MRQTFLLHGVIAHVNNGIVPVTAFFLLVAIMTGDSRLDYTILHLLSITVCMVPVSFVSGLRDWRRKFGRRRAPVFYRKMFLTALLFLLGGTAMSLRLIHEDLFAEAGAGAAVYFACILGSVPVVVLLGHYGAKLSCTKR